MLGCWIDAKEEKARVGAYQCYSDKMDMRNNFISIDRSEHLGAQPSMEDSQSREQISDRSRSYS